MLRQKRSTLVFSVCSALCLTLVKTAGGLATHSMAVLASAADSFMDLLISLVNLLALKEADRPADRSHPYGHGKIEHVAGLFQCFFMSCSVFYLVWEALRRIIEGTYLMRLGLGYGIMAFSIAVTLLIVLRLRWIAKKTQSIILETESLHYSTDILTNLGTLGVLFLVQRTGMLFWDLLFSLVIAAYLGVQIYRIARRAVNELIDHEPPKELQEEIVRFVLGFDARIADLHDFRARLVGGNIFTEFHVIIRKENDFGRAHDLVERLISALRKKYPKMEATVHYDPEGVREPRRAALQE